MKKQLIESYKSDFKNCITLAKSYILLNNHRKAEDFLIEADCIRDRIYDLQKRLGVANALEMDRDMAEEICATRRLLGVSTARTR